MHICFVCGEYPPAPHGGIGSFVQTLGRELARREHSVSAVGTYGFGPELEGEEDDRGVRVIRVPSRGLPYLRILSNRLRLLKTLGELHRKMPIDILEGSEVAFAGISASAPGLKLMRMHGGPRFFNLPSWKERMAERHAFRITEEFCAVSHCVAEGTRKLFHLNGRPVEVIPNPVNTEEFSPAPGETEEEGLIVFTGTVIERKGIVQLVQAIPRIVAEVPYARLEVYGGEAIDPPPAQPLAETLNNALPPEVRSHIQWKGRVPRGVLPGALRRASVCVYPSHIEAMPIGWLEGLATGKAVVASRTGPGPEIIDDGITGLLCDPHDPDSIADKIIRLLRNADERWRLGRAARKMAVERYSLQPLVDRNLRYYERLIGSQSARTQIGH